MWASRAGTHVGADLENRTGGIKWHATHKINPNKIILHKEQEVTNNNNNTIINNNN